jgi:phosphatidylserine decarboxylase
MVKDGFFYAIGFGLVAWILWHFTGSWWVAAIPVLLALFFLWFFRDPSRDIPTGQGLIVSPGDGVVTEADWVETNAGSRLRLSIFLSVFNVHVNRVPIGGTVTLCEHRKGQFLNAMNKDSAILNEQTLITIDAGDYEVSFKQIAGLLARRIVCNLKVGDVVERGDRMGLIKFGSRVDVLMPADAELRVSKGDRVSGGATVLAVLSNANAAAATLARAVGE